MPTDPILRRAAEAVVRYFGLHRNEGIGGMEGATESAIRALGTCPGLTEAVAKAEAMDALEALAVKMWATEKDRIWLCPPEGPNLTTWALLNDNTHATLGEGPTLASAIFAAAGRGVESDKPQGGAK